MTTIKVFSAILLATSITLAAGKSDKKSAAAITKREVTGTVNWVGYGVGKSHTGNLTVKSGAVEMSGKDLIGGSFVIDMTSLKTSDSPKLQAHLQSPDFFDVTQFPEATFKITKVEAAPPQDTNKATHIVTGNLTIKGKTNPAVITLTLANEKEKWTAIGSSEIKDRTKFDIVYNSKQFKTASALGDKLIEDNIKLDLNLATK